MKDLIIQALNEAFEMVQKTVPKTKKVWENRDISSVNPLELATFMWENNIPQNAEFDTFGNYGLATSYPVLSWQVEKETSEEEKNESIKNRFNSSAAFRAVAKILIENGYRRIHGGKPILKESQLYETFLKKDFDVLVNDYFINFLEKTDN